MHRMVLTGVPHSVIVSTCSSQAHINALDFKGIDCILLVFYKVLTGS